MYLPTYWYYYYYYTLDICCIYLIQWKHTLQHEKLVPNHSTGAKCFRYHPGHNISKVQHLQIPH